MKHKVLENTNLGNAFRLTLERNNLQFKTGQHIDLNMINSPYKRLYSIYSGEHESYIQFLIKEIDGGDTSPLLKNLKSGEYVELGKPEGYFTIDTTDLIKKFYFVCTGTGIAPFHSFIKTYQSPLLNYFLIHGTKTKRERYDSEDYGMYIHYTSQDHEDEDICSHGHVTDYFIKKDVDQDALYYLCGLGKMIYDMDILLGEKGVPVENIFWEVYHAERI
jgi:ferredoxin--NADP+ reductase/benzoate/toluate 1,2-dioxygenase reductase subunit